MRRRWPASIGSIAGRVVLLVLAVELLAAMAVTGFAFFYEREMHFRSFDVALRGRADTVMGAVGDADDAKLGVMLDTTDLRLPRGDVYAVREEGGVELGRSPDWVPGAGLWSGDGRPFRLTVGRRRYRGIRVRGVRVVDPMAANVRHRLTVLYASPTEEVWEAVWGAVEVFAVANGLLVLVTALLVPLIVRRSLAPLRALAAAAEEVTATAWRFAPGAEVREVGELRPLAEAMEAVLGRLERSFAQQQRFVGDAAHELKTGIAVVKSSIQLLELRARTPEEYRAGLGRCYADCLRMEGLAQQMLLMARVEASSVEEGCCEADEGVRAAVAELGPMAALGAVSLVVEGAGAGLVGVTAEMWRSVLVNLLTNAVQHSAAGTEVRVTVGQRGDAMRVVVADRGCGIGAEALPFVFDRFFRADASRTRATGSTGLGLAIAKAVVERAGGRIGLESRVGEGTTVEVVLPVVVDAVEQPSACLQAAG